VRDFWLSLCFSLYRLFLFWIVKGTKFDMLLKLRDSVSGPTFKINVNTLNMKVGAIPSPIVTLNTNTLSVNIQKKECLYIVRLQV